MCEKGYNQKENYQKHIRAHKGLKYRCKYCGKAFSSQPKLKCHMSEHTGKFRFMCDKCDKGFNVKQSFEKHSKRHC